MIKRFCVLVLLCAPFLLNASAPLKKMGGYNYFATPEEFTRVASELPKAQTPGLLSYTLSPRALYGNAFLMANESLKLGQFSKDPDSLDYFYSDFDISISKKGQERIALEQIVTVDVLEWLYNHGAGEGKARVKSYLDLAVRYALLKSAVSKVRPFDFTKTEYTPLLEPSEAEVLALISTDIVDQKVKLGGSLFSVLTTSENFKKAKNAKLKEKQEQEEKKKKDEEEKKKKLEKEEKEKKEQEEKDKKLKEEEKKKKDEQEKLIAQQKKLTDEFKKKQEEQDKLKKEQEELEKKLALEKDKEKLKKLEEEKKANEQKQKELEEAQKKLQEEQDKKNKAAAELAQKQLEEALVSLTGAIQALADAIHD